MIGPEATVTEMPDDKDIKDDPFDIRDESMEMDDAVMSDAAPAEPLETAPDPDASNWQTELVSRAQAAKLPAEIVEKLKGADAVDLLLSAISGAVQKQPPERETVPEQEPEQDAGQFGLDIDEATAFDPDMAKAVKAMNAHYAERIRSLEARLADRSAADRSTEVGSFVKELGSEWSTVFGTGDKPNEENVRRLEEAASTIRAGFAARHKRVPQQRDLLKMALNAEFGDRQGEIARNTLNDKVAKRSSQIVSRPGTRTAPPSNPRMRAAQGVADWFKSKGIDPYGASEDAFA